MPADGIVRLNRFEAKHTVFVMNGVKISSRKQRSDSELHWTGKIAHEFPTENDKRPAMRCEKFLVNEKISLKIERPGWPWFDNERGQSFCALRGEHIWAVPLRGNGDYPSGSLNPGFEPVNEDHALSRGRSRRNQQTVIAAGSNARDSAAGEAAQTISFKPFGFWRKENFRGHTI
jgi:hypothetical protein